MVGQTNGLDELVDILTQIHDINTKLTINCVAVNRQLTGLVTFRDIMGTQIKGLLKKTKDLMAEVVILYRTVASSLRGSKEHAKITILKLKYFDVVHSAMEQGIFFVGFETLYCYCLCVYIMIVCYFRNDAVLWQRTKNANDKSVARTKCDTWTKLRDALREMFLPRKIHLALLWTD
ncbi:hypothetical protein CQW23_07551 [Capsicum baccatum]|uniref:Uncharacterized protein n=1 Tax=Capsicum baccatum TaxID=33114 RepID=A0A2G2X6N5_CAPBA|nr:hypothetical protein CQW23_07551 [Capsicum baccatum]